MESSFVQVFTIDFRIVTVSSLWTLRHHLFIVFLIESFQSCGWYQQSSGYSLLFVIADILSAVLLRATGQKLQKAYRMNLRRLGVLKSSQDRGKLKLFNKFRMLSILSYTKCFKLEYGNMRRTRLYKIWITIFLGVNVYLKVLFPVYMYISCWSLLIFIDN